jgi:predicted nucleotidyltransferase
MTIDVLRAAAAVTRREQVLIRRVQGYALAMSDLPDKLGAISAAAAAFSDNGVRFALIGGLAVGVRTGVPRATLDVDFAIPTHVDRSWLVDRLVERGFRLKGSFAHSVNLEHESGEPVQLAFDPQFDPMITRAEVVSFGDIEISVVTKEDLIAMKRRAAADPGRRRSKALRDQADLALLEGDIPGPDEGW